MSFMQDHIQRNNATTITAHIVLVVSSSLSLIDFGLNLGFATVALALYIATGVLGTIIYCFGNNGYTSYKVYSNLWLWSLSLGLPSISSQLYAASNFCSRIIILHFLPPLVFIIYDAFSKRTRFIVLEVMQTAYVISVYYISFINSNYYGFALATSYAISFYAIGLTGMIQNTPAKDLLSISFAFSNYFMTKTLKYN